ncbi:uncharacterized protein LOC129768805 [Toxorhynchites rutilus septentrionalis]|uniref:uncharacterized protein LOC129768805 n=1 Tax=Toxorhynchites rutilus septentrionalis TaxID=329112 RepID=UPI0024787702|nr:uncharacterized protein LOC129768805 [Toxorhynchites rutilus septentrionalis]
MLTFLYFGRKLRISNTVLNVRNIYVKSTTKLGFPCMYSEDETRKILDTLNKDDVEQLYKYNISKYRLKKIDDWRKKFGSFMTLDDVLELDGFGINVLRKFCDSIVKCPSVETTQTKPAKKDVKFTTPVIPVHVVPRIKSCVSLHIGLDFITWAKFEIERQKPSVLAGWSSFAIPDRKLHVSELIRNVTQLNHLIPEADVYVVENPAVAQSMAMGNALQTNINVQKSQLIAMIMLMLSSRPTDDVELKECNVFFMKQYSSARLFGIFVGSERISAEGVVRSLIEHRVGPNESQLNEQQSELIIPSGLRVVYEGCDRAEKEFMGQSMLLGLSFLRLCIFKCEQSLQIFRR